MEILKSSSEALQKPSWVLQAESNPNSNIRVLKRDLEGRYVKFGILPQSIFFKKPDTYGYVSIPANKVVSLEKKLLSEIHKQKALDECVKRNNRGKELERLGLVDGAIVLYEENIEPGCWPATHSFDRLLAIYRSRRDYKNEYRVCKRAVSVFKNMDKYNTRLTKINELLKRREYDQN